MSSFSEIPASKLTTQTSEVPHPDSHHTEKTRELVSDPHSAGTHEKSREVTCVAGDPHAPSSEHARTREIVSDAPAEVHAPHTAHARELLSTTTDTPKAHDTLGDHSSTTDKKSVVDKAKEVVGLGDKESSKHT